MIGHQTLASNVAGNAPLPSETSGVEAMVVRLGGTTARPDGGTYHITWSLARSKEREAIESNDVIAKLGWRNLPAPVAIALEPAPLS